MFVIVVGLLLWVGAADADPGEVAAIRDARATLEVRPHAEDEVWRNIRAGGLPLVEDHPEDADLRRVTFAIQAPQSVEAIRLDSVINAGEARQPVENYLTDFTLDMHRLAGTRIYYRTVDVPRDVSAAYSFLGLADQGWRRLTDRYNRVHLRGGAAEAVLMAEARYRHPAIVPMPAAERVDARSMALESEVLRTEREIEMLQQDELLQAELERLVIEAGTAAQAARAHADSWALTRRAQGEVERDGLLAQAATHEEVARKEVAAFEAELAALEGRGLVVVREQLVDALAGTRFKLTPFTQDPAPERVERVDLGAGGK